MDSCLGIYHTPYHVLVQRRSATGVMGALKRDGRHAACKTCQCIGFDSGSGSFLVAQETGISWFGVIGCSSCEIQQLGPQGLPMDTAARMPLLVPANLHMSHACIRMCVCYSDGTTFQVGLKGNKRTTRVLGGPSPYFGTYLWFSMLIEFAFWVVLRPRTDTFSSEPR